MRHVNVAKKGWKLTHEGNATGNSAHDPLLGDTGGVADHVEDAGNDPGGGEGGSGLGVEEAVEEGEEDELGEVLEGVLVGALGAVEDVGSLVLFSMVLFGVHERVGHVGSLASCADLHAHESGEPDGTDDRGDAVSKANGKKDGLRGNGLGSEEVVEGGKARGKG